MCRFDSPTSFRIIAELDGLITSIMIIIRGVPAIGAKAAKPGEWICQPGAASRVPTGRGATALIGTAATALIGTAAGPAAAALITAALGTTVIFRTILAGRCLAVLIA